MSIRDSVSIPGTDIGHEVTADSTAVSPTLSPSVMHRSGVRPGTEASASRRFTGSADSSIRPSPVQDAAVVAAEKREGSIESFLTQTNLRRSWPSASSMILDRRSVSMSP